MGVCDKADNCYHKRPVGRSVTPNQLWKDVVKLADKEEIPYCILKDPGSFVDNKFKTVIKEIE